MSDGLGRDVWRDVGAIYGPAKQQFVPWEANTLSQRGRWFPEDEALALEAVVEAALATTWPSRAQWRQGLNDALDRLDAARKAAPS